MRDEMEDKDGRLVSESNLLENGVVGDDLGWQRHGTLDTYDNIPGKIIKWGEKKNLSVKGKRRKTNNSRDWSAMVRDLKVFADSLMRELIIAREGMLEHMREEMENLMDCRPCKKKVRFSNKNGIVVGTCSAASTDSSNTYNLPGAVEYNRVFELTTSNEPCKGNNRSKTSALAGMVLANSPNQPVSSRHLALPMIQSDPQLQNHWTRIPSDDLIPTGEATKNNSGWDDTEVVAWLDAESFVQLESEEQFGFLEQSGSETGCTGIGFNR